MRCIQNRWKMMLLAILAAGMLWFVAAPAHAQGEWRRGEPDGVSSIRPIGSFRISVMSGLPDLIGVSFTLKATHPIELEGGISTLLFGWSGYARMGPAFNVFNNRGYGGRGWTLDIVLMGGYRFLEGNLFSNLAAHGITLNGAFNATYWFAPHFGLDMRISLGAGYWVASNKGTAEPPIFPDGRISVGIAF